MDIESIARIWPLGLFFIILAIMLGAIQRQHNAGRRAIDEVYEGGRKRGGRIRSLATLFLIVASTVLLIVVLGETGIGYFLVAGLAATFYEVAGDVARKLDNAFQIGIAAIGALVLASVVAQSAKDAKDANQ